MKLPFLRHITIPALLLTVFLSISSKNSDLEHIVNDEYSNSDSVFIVFAGDIMGHMPQIEAAFDHKRGTYDFTSCYTYIKPYIATADLAIANLEVPLAGKPYSGYPRFSSPDELFDGALTAGFDVMQLANNHIADRGKLGIKRTYHTVNKNIKSVGIYPNKAVRDSLYPLVLTVKGLKLAILNCTFGTNGHPVPFPFIVNNIDTIQIKKDIVTAKHKGAQCVIMTIHWGNEYELNANNSQVRLARWMVQAGVDVIIGTHPHVVQNFDTINKPDGSVVPVYYSLGNMISNQRWRSSNGGIVARIVLSRSTGKVISTDHMPFYVYKGKLNDRFQYYIVPTERYLSGGYPFHFSAGEDSMLVTFDQDTRERLKNVQRWK